MSVNSIARSTILLICFLPGILYLVICAKRSRVELTSRLDWEYAGRILNRPFVVGYPEAAQHDPSRIEHLPVNSATAADRPLAPYSDFACEYPPGALLVFSAIRLPFDEISRFLTAFQLVMGSCCVIATILTFLAIRTHNDGYFTGLACALGFSAWALMEGGFTINQFDSCSMLAAALALLFYSRARPHLAAAALGLGGAIKLWPLLLLPALALTSMSGGSTARRRFGLSCTIIAAGILAFAIPLVIVLMLGTSPSDLFAYGTYASRRGLDIFSVPGNLVVLGQLIRGTESHIRYSYGTIGVVAPETILIARVFQLIFLALYAAALARYAWRKLTLPEFANLCGLLVVIALLTSKIFNANYLLWLYPVYLIDLAGRQWKVPRLYLLLILTFKILGWSEQSVVFTRLPGALLVFFKNSLALSLMIAFIWALDCRRNARPERVPGDHKGPGVQK